MTVKLNFDRDVKKYLEFLDPRTQATIRRRLENLRLDDEIGEVEGKYLETVIRDTSPGITVIYQYRERQLMIYRIIVHRQASLR
ncbi:hypothetical protein IGS68_10120 [Skermanella sp. TT6]|uniref:Uncharacterized protein n=1 Tax=Skermanella cutis TaxID=2775420 RepID=A0ABX7BET4_9PROT|nr:hypothetical protein [Skermanella sp. TT6]QQP92659.1 hypothetical protein IGS68_10120 [Skermanella sp. TT6]